MRYALCLEPQAWCRLCGTAGANLQLESGTEGPSRSASALGGRGLGRHPSHASIGSPLNPKPKKRKKGLTVKFGGGAGHG